MTDHLQFKVGDIVRTKVSTNDDKYRHAVLAQGRILELDEVNRTALVKGCSTPIPLADLEPVPSYDPTDRGGDPLRRLGFR